jgi:hypothetical protein
MRSAIVIGVILAGLAAPVQAQTGAALSDADLRELIDAAKATAKATRESVDHARVTPDILTQILTKLDKIEDKLDKVENAIKRDNPVRKSTR